MIKHTIAWGIANDVGLVFKSLLDELAQENLADYIQTFFLQTRQNGQDIAKQEQLEITFGQAIAEFLRLVQQALEDADCPDAEFPYYSQSLQQFLHHPIIQLELGKPFDPTCQYCDAETLAQTWQDLPLRELPDEFDWQQITKQYQCKVRIILEKSPHLSALLKADKNTEILSALTTDSQKQNTLETPPSNSDLIRYCQHIEQKYGYLNLDILHVSGYQERLKLGNIFVPQTVHKYKKYDDIDISIQAKILVQISKYFGVSQFCTLALLRGTETLAMSLLWVILFPKLNQDILGTLLSYVKINFLKGLNIYDDKLEEFILDLLIEKLKLTNISPEIRIRYEQYHNTRSLYSVLEFIENKPIYPYLIIVGNPGSGKSSLLQYLTIQWASTPIDDLSQQPLLLLIELRAYVRFCKKQKSQTFLDFCQHSYSLNSHYLEERLKTGQVFVLFDGLDEIFDLNRREAVITEIIDLAQTYPHVQILITSRVIGYSPERLRSAKFRHFILQELDDKQIQQFIQRWHKFAFNCRPEGEKKYQRLQQAIQESKAIRELAGNPLLLTMMAILNRHQELPKNRAELYKQASKVLLQQWDVGREVVEAKSLKFDYQDKQAILGKLAYHMQSNNKGNLINYKELVGILTEYLNILDRRDNPLKTQNSFSMKKNTQLIIKQLQERNFILCFLGADYYGFVHRTFLEYFCAWEYVRRFQKERSLTLEELKIEVFGKHWQDKSWYEVLRLIMAMIDAKFVGEILDYLIYLIVKDITKDGVLEGFSDLFRFANRVFLVANYLLDVRNRAVIHSTEVKFLQYLKWLNQYEPPSEYQFDKRYVGEIRTLREIRIQAMYAIAKIGKDNPNILLWLKQKAISDKYSKIRGTALNILVRDWKEHPDTLSILQNRAKKDSDQQVREFAKHTLGKWESLQQQKWEDSQASPLSRLKQLFSRLLNLLNL